MGSHASGPSWLTSSRLSSNTPPLNSPSQGNASRAAELRWRRENSREARSDWFRASGAACCSRRIFPKSARISSGPRVPRGGPTARGAAQQRLEPITTEPRIVEAAPVAFQDAREQPQAVGARQALDL